MERLKNKNNLKLSNVWEISATLGTNMTYNPGKIPLSLGSG